MSERSEQQPPPPAPAAVEDLQHAPTHSLVAVLRIRDFRHLWIGLGLSSLGDWMGLLALTAMANASADSYAGKNYAIATVLFLRVLPALVMGPIAGYVADRLDRRTVLIWGDYLRGALFLTIPLVGSLWWIFVVTVLVEAISLVWGPAKDATVPNLVPRHRLEAANQVSLATTYGSALPAAAIFAGLTLVDKFYRHVFDWFGGSGPVDLALYFNALSFVVSGIVISRLRTIPRGPADVDTEATAISVIVDGWRYVVTTPVVRGLVIGIVGAFAAGGVVIGLARTYVSDLGGGDAGYGLLFGTVFTGLGLGMWRGPAAAAGAVAAPAVRHLADADRAAALPAGAGAAAAGRGRADAGARLLRRRRLDHRQHHARPRGARRDPRPDLRVRRLDDPAVPRAGARAGAAGRRA